MEAKNKRQKIEKEIAVILIFEKAFS